MGTFPQNICRLCMMSTSQMRSIFAKGLSRKISKLTSIQICKKDGHSQLICLQCETFVQQIDIFFKKCKESDKYFKTLSYKLQLQNRKKAKKKLSTKTQNRAQKLLILERARRKKNETLNSHEQKLEDPKVDAKNEAESKSDDVVDKKNSKKITMSSVGPPENDKLTALPLRKTEEKDLDSNVDISDISQDVDDISQDDVDVPSTNNCSSSESDSLDNLPLKTLQKTSNDAMETQSQSPTENEIPNLKNTKNKISQYKASLVACYICGKLYPTYEIKYHMNLHTGEHPFVCDMNSCVKKFPTPKSLYRHKRMCHPAILQPVTCDICGVTIKSAKALISHKKFHWEPTVPCKICGKLLLNSRSLKKHLKTHTGRRPFRCIECDKSFSTKYNLDVHMRCHTKEKPFSCSECGDSFTYNCRLKIHIQRVHKHEN